jgi:hypothetical protein
MGTLEKANETQLHNILTRTGKTLTDFRMAIEDSGLKKHSDVRKMLMEKFELGYGDANAMIRFVQTLDDQGATQAQYSSMENVIAEIYSGPKSDLRPIHDRLMVVITQLGEYEIAPKKGYISLRKKRQFAMIGPGTKGRMELGLNMKGIAATDRLTELPPGGMCQYKVFLTSVGEVDNEVVGWIKIAYESAG